MSKTLLVSLFLTVSLSGCTLATRQAELEPFPRTSDYDYGLADMEGARNHDVQLTENGFEWPVGMSGVDTALLEFRLQQASGQSPAIAVDANGVTVVQYFEQGGKGRRYLDISKLLEADIVPGELIELINRGAQWSLESTTLTTFANPSLVQRRVLVVAPHPDDAEIAAFGVYQSSLADVVTITAGDAGGANFASLWEDEGEHYREKGRIRTLDSLTVPFLGGLKPEAVRNLGYYDATLRQLWMQRPNVVGPPLADLEDPGYFRRLNFDNELRNREFTSNWSSLVADLLRELERVQPETVVVPHPRLDRHLDHQYAAIALFEALALWGGICDVLLYTNHAIGNEAFPLGPRDGMTGLPAWQGEGLHAKRIYSHQLSVEEQRRKLIALEAMHDLRPFDPRDGSDVTLSNPLFDYFRRGPRPNEIFLVTDIAGAAALYREFTN